MHVSEGELKEFITDSGLVAKKEIDDAAEEARKKGVSVGDLLVSRGALTEDALRRIQAYVLGIPFVSLKDFRIDAATLSLIPEPIARAHNAIAYKRDGENLEIALLDIDDLAAVAAVSKRAGLSLKPRLADGESLRGALLQYQQLLKSAFGDIIATEVARLSAPASAEGTLADQELRRAAEDPAAVRIVDALLRHAAAQRASDLHIEPTESDVVVRYRIGGTLRDAMSLPKRAAPAIAARTKALAALKLDERRLPQEGRFKMEAEGAQTAFCVSVLPTAFGEKVVLRLLRAGSEGFTLESIGFHGAGLEQVHRALRATSGLVLIAGPAGSGKTTTLYTLLDVLNAPDVSIATIEDPIEYQLARVSQSQVDPATGFTFANGVRALVRHDADIIAIGEIRDAETAALAASAAAAGRLVLATVRANCAADALPRLIELGVDPALLASATRLILGERLVRRLAGPNEAYRLTAEERAGVAPDAAFAAVLGALKEEGAVAPGTTLDALAFYRPLAAGGYAGAIGIHEVLDVSVVRDVLAQGRPAIEQAAKRAGTLTALEEGIYAAARGATSLDEARRAASG